MAPLFHLSPRPLNPNGEKTKRNKKIITLNYSKYLYVSCVIDYKVAMLRRETAHIPILRTFTQAKCFLRKIYACFHVNLRQYHNLC